MPIGWPSRTVITPLIGVEETAALLVGGLLLRFRHERCRHRLSGGRARTGGEDAGHWRAEAEGLRAQVREAGSPQQVLDFAGGAAGRVRRELTAGLFRH